MPPLSQPIRSVVFRVIWTLKRWKKKIKVRFLLRSYFIILFFVYVAYMIVVTWWIGS